MVWADLLRSELIYYDQLRSIMSDLILSDLIYYDLLWSSMIYYDLFYSIKIKNNNKTHPQTHAQCRQHARAPSIHPQYLNNNTTPTQLIKCPQTRPLQFLHNPRTIQAHLSLVFQHQREKTRRARKFKYSNLHFRKRKKHRRPPLNPISSLATYYRCAFTTHN